MSSAQIHYNQLQSEYYKGFCDKCCFSFTADVNFASELSDLRHRHGFQVILVHGSHTSSALLQHAHCHVAFQEITADLPPRMLVKAQVGPTNASLRLKML